MLIVGCLCIKCEFLYIFELEVLFVCLFDVDRYFILKMAYAYFIT